MDTSTSGSIAIQCERAEQTIAKMTIESDIVERRNEENLKMTKHIEDTMKFIIRGENEIIEPIAAPIDGDIDANTTHNGPVTSQTELQRFYGGKNVFITGGTGEW